jgi:hypothetical protein
MNTTQWARPTTNTSAFEQLARVTYATSSIKALEEAITHLHDARMYATAANLMTVSDKLSEILGWAGWLVTGPLLDATSSDDVPGKH